MEMEVPQPTPEHKWLHRMIGEWTVRIEGIMGPDQPPVVHEGEHSVKGLGELWTLGRGTVKGTDGNPMSSLMTLGYDPAAQQFVGTFIASVMTHLWPYRGTLNTEKTILTLDSHGPGMSGGMTDYQDIFEFVSDNHFILRSRMKMDDGSFVQFMTADYHRQGT